MSEQFRIWFVKELTKGRWTQGKLAEATNFSQSYISRVSSGAIEPSADFCLELAKFFKKSPETVLRIADYLPAYVDDEDIQEIIDLVKNLPQATRKEILQYIRFKYQQEVE